MALPACRFASQRVVESARWLLKFLKIFVAHLLCFATFTHLSNDAEYLFAKVARLCCGDNEQIFFVTTKKNTTRRTIPAPAAKSKRPALTTAAAILGQSVSPTRNGQAKIKPEWAKYYQILIDLRSQLIRQMSGLAKESAQELPGYSLHMADSGTDNFDRDFALSLLSSDQDAVYEIDEALKRIEKNTYGVCELTGKAIPKARLDAIPWARFTVEAQGQLERDGALRQRRLGTLGSLEGVAAADVEEEEEAEEKPTKEKE